MGVTMATGSTSTSVFRVRCRLPSAIQLVGVILFHPTQFAIIYLEHQRVDFEVDSS